MARLKDFRGLEGQNFFELDRGFQTLLADLLPEAERGPVFDSLRACAALVSGRWDEMAREASRHEHLPRLVKHDRVGNPVERVELGPLTRQYRREVAEFGVLTRARSEAHKFALIYLLSHNGEGSLTCGLSCTDGLIRAIEAKGPDPLRETYLPPLYSAETPFAAAQFVTEQAGGSDVGAIEAAATPNADGSWSITGEKWFCSNPDEYYFVAARPAGAPAGTKGLAVFLIPRVLPDGRVNALSFRRLKDKLGTRSLPTAEIDFQGATGYAIGDPADGFKTLMHYMINSSRVHNAIGACGFLHRAFLEARNYARQREAFGGALINYPLIQEPLVGMVEKLWRDRLLTFRLIALLDEHGIAPDDAGQAMWQRVLINLAKYRTSATLAGSVREAILTLGANGIVEDFSVLPRLLRDTLILETWEGTHNTLCLQIMRDAARSDLVGRWRSEVGGALERWPRDLLAATRGRVAKAFGQAVEALTPERLGDRRWAETHARRLVDLMGGLLEAVWMAEVAARHAGHDATAALLAAAAARRRLPDDSLFDNPIQQTLSKCALALIEEQPVHSDVSAL